MLTPIIEGFIEFIVSPSLEVCGDVLDRVHYQMAEANSRPVLPVSAKAVSMVAVAGGGGPSKALPRSCHTKPIEHGQRRPEPNKAPTSDRKSPQAPDQSGPAPRALPQPVPAPKQSSTLASSSETLASNLRKMIVSSSASLSRKLNITSSGSIGVLTSQSLLRSTRLATDTKPSRCDTPLRKFSSASVSIPDRPATTVTRPSSGNDDFEARQAGYKHPVIQCADRPAKAAGSEAVCNPCDAEEHIESSCSNRTSAYLDSSDSERTSVDGCSSLSAAQVKAVSQTGHCSELATKR